MMLGRVVGFIALQLTGAALGALVAQWPGALGGLFLGGLTWFAWDTAAALRVLRWLRDTDSNPVPLATGLRGQSVARVCKLLRLRAQETLASDERLREFLSAIQASPVGVVLLDDETRIEWCNQTAAELLGFDAQRDILQHIGNLVRDPAFTAYMARADFTSEVVITGRHHLAEQMSKVSVQLHPYGEGRKLLLARDVTALEQAETMRRDFVANVSHEIRTPLTVLAGFVETLQTLALPQEDRQRYLGLMAQQSQRMQNLVNDLLVLSRLEGSPVPGWQVWTPAAQLMAVCQDEAQSLSGLLGSHDLSLSFAVSVQSGAPNSASLEFELAGAVTELRSAMSNLIGNAIRYTPDGGRVQVCLLWCADGRARFTVQDTGPGVAPEHLPRLSERFYRVDRSRSRETGGTGLGLAIVKHVVSRHGGELQLHSQLGVGSEFGFYLPANRVRALTQPELSAALSMRKEVAQ